MSDPHTPGSGASPPPPEPTGVARDATCPFMRTLLVQSPELADPDSRTMSRAELHRFVRRQRPPGVDGSLEKVLLFFARVNQTPLSMKLGNLVTGRDRFSLRFPGSRGDHPGSTDIYSRADGGFDAAAFERVVAHSSDGRRMTPRDMASAILEANANPSNPGSPVDLANSAGEFALLFNLLGGDGGAEGIDIGIADMRQLFERNEWPDGALDNLGRATLGGWLAVTREILRHIAELKFDGDRDGRGAGRLMGHLRGLFGRLSGN